MVFTLSNEEAKTEGIQVQARVRQGKGLQPILAAYAAGVLPGESRPHLQMRPAFFYTRSPEG